MCTQTQILSHCVWQYWTGLCSVFVLSDNAEGYGIFYSNVVYNFSFGKQYYDHIADWNHEYNGCLSIKNFSTTKHLVIENKYFIPKNAKKNDWFCVYSWEFE